MDQGGSHGGDEKWSDSGNVLKVGSLGIADGLDMGKEEKTVSECWVNKCGAIFCGGETEGFEVWIWVTKKNSKNDSIRV